MTTISKKGVGLIAALGVAFLGAATATPASATTIPQCGPGEVTATWHGDGSFTASTVGEDAADCSVWLTSYVGVDRQLTPGDYSHHQVAKEWAHAHVTADPKVFSVGLPECDNTQVDLYLGALQLDLPHGELGSAFVAGGVVEQEACAPVVVPPVVPPTEPEPEPEPTPPVVTPEPEPTPPVVEPEPPVVEPTPEPTPPVVVPEPEPTPPAEVCVPPLLTAEDGSCVPPTFYEEPPVVEPEAPAVIVPVVEQPTIEEIQRDAVAVPPRHQGSDVNSDQYAAESLAYTGASPLLVGSGIAGGLLLIALGTLSLVLRHWRKTTTALK